MRKLLLTALLATGIALPCHAVTIRQTSTGKGLGISGTMSGSTYIKGNKMRSDVVHGDKTLATIFDVDAQKMYIFDSKKKEADVWDMGCIRAGTLKERGCVEHKSVLETKRSNQTDKRKDGCRLRSRDLDGLGLGGKQGHEHDGYPDRARMDREECARRGGLQPVLQGRGREGLDFS
jgi:hypothetical protein